MDNGSGGDDDSDLSDGGGNNTKKNNSNKGKGKGQLTKFTKVTTGNVNTIPNQVTSKLRRNSKKSSKEEAQRFWER